MVSLKTGSGEFSLSLYLEKLVVVALQNSIKIKSKFNIELYLVKYVLPKFLVPNRSITDCRGRERNL